VKNNSNYEKTYHSHAASNGGHALELVHDRRRKAGAEHYHHVNNHSEEEHRARQHRSYHPNNHDPVLGCG
jgi:hypothetical protein